ncbi:MAG: hypothetical protein ACOX4H_09980 [Bacillota bacterium]|nr:hypothetical protein [Clostridia bacterium]
MSAAEQRPAKRIAVSGILAAFCLLTLYLATLLPTNRIFFYGLSSVFGAVIIIEHNVRGGVLFYIATSLLALILIPHKLRLIPYIFILGHYPIWKTYIERLNHPGKELLLKLLVLDLGTFAAYYVFTKLFFMNITLPIDLRLAFLVLQPVFLIYDYVFTLFINFYLQNIRPHLND